MPEERGAAKRGYGAPRGGAGGRLPHPLEDRGSAGYRRGEDVGDAHPLGVAALAGNRADDQDPGLLNFDPPRDDALAFGRPAADVDLRALDPDVNTLDSLAVLGDVDLERRP